MGDNPYVIAAHIKKFNYSRYSNNKLERPITAEDAAALNKKDTWNGWQAGMETERFDSIDQIKQFAIEKFQCDLIFVGIRGIDDIDSSVYKHTPFPDPKKTGQKIMIQNFRGFSPNFENLTEGSVHEVIETPEQYKGRKLLDGYWVHGVYEPALVLINECKIVE